MNNNNNKILLFKMQIIVFQAVMSMAGTPSLLQEPDTDCPLSSGDNCLGDRKRLFCIMHILEPAELCLTSNLFPNKILTSLCAVLLWKPPLQLHYSTQSCYSGFPNTASPFYLKTPSQAVHGMPDEPFQW